MGRLTNIARRVLAGRPPVGQTPADVVHTENKWRLLRYRNDDARHARPILLVPSLINRHYILDLMPQKSFVQWLVQCGWDVFVIDWGKPGREDQWVELSDYCDRWLRRAVGKCARLAGADRVHLLGYCLGGTLTTIYGALYPDTVASMVNLAAPIDFDDDGLLSVWSQMESLSLTAVIEAFGNMPWPLMQAGFHLLRPTLNLQKLVYAVDRAWDDEFLDGFIALETWGNDNVSFPGRAFKTYIEELYRANRLVRGELWLDGKHVDLGAIDFPLLAVTFEHDNIVSAQSAGCIVDLVGSTDVERLHLRGGHVGAVVSRKAAQGLWPQLEGWIGRYDAPVRLVAGE